MESVGLSHVSLNTNHMLYLFVTRLKFLFMIFTNDMTCMNKYSILLCFSFLDDLDILVTTKFRINEKFGHAFFDVSEANVNFNMTGLKLQLDDIFYGIKFLGESLFFVSII